MSEPVYSRAPDVVWRLGPDRVLVRRVGGKADDAAEFTGEAAFIWIAMDEPGSIPELEARLASTQIRLAAPQALDELVGLGWFRTARKAQSI